MDNVLDRAIVFATEAHEGQFRKGTQIPYILHPMEAAAIVGTMTTDNEVIAGAVLHDVVEDTDTTVEQVCELFGDLFDFNNDGKLDSFEKAAEFGAFMQMIDSVKNDELTSAGLDPQELSEMGYSERREALEEAGLDPDDYDL